MTVPVEAWPVPSELPTGIRSAKKVDHECKAALCFSAHSVFEKDYLRPFPHSLASSYELLQSTRQHIEE